MKRKTKPKLGFISIHRAPYRDPVLELINSRANINLEVIILFQEDAGHPYWHLNKPGYPHLFFKSKNYYLKQFHCRPGIWQLLSEKKYDVIAIPGYYHPTCVIALLYCICTKTPFIWLSDACVFKARPLYLRIIKWPLMKAIIRLMGAAWVPGIAGEEFLVSYGAERNKIFRGLYTLDAKPILESLEESKASQQQIKDLLNLKDENIVLLMVANLIPKRGLGYLMEAMIKLLGHNKELNLVVIGDGPEKHNIELLMKHNPRLKEHVHLIGPVPFESLTGYYLLADAYVHSSVREEYSVSIAHAAICGLPIITTDRVGAAYDYVIDGVTGAIAKACDSRSLADAINLVVSDRNRSETMGMQAQQKARELSVEWAANQLEKSVIFSLHNYEKDEYA